MRTDTFDPIRFKTGQRQQWDQVAPGWQKWWQTFERAAGHVSHRLIELADIQVGQHVLDVATGIGEPALAVAQRVGPTGHVTAADQAAQMLAIAQERAATLGVSNVTFHEADVEILNFSAASFHAVLSRWGLMFLPNLADFLHNMRQMLVPGGYFAAAVWDVPQRVPLISLTTGVAQRMFQLPPPPAGTPSIFDLADGGLEKAMIEAGFSEITTDALTVNFEFESTEVFRHYCEDVAGPLVTMLEKKTPTQQNEFWQEVDSALQPYLTALPGTKTADGILRIPSSTICVAGQR